MDTAVHVEWVKELVIWTADQPREQFVIHSRHADHEILLGKQSIEPVGLDNVWRDGEPGQKCRDKERSRLSIFLLYLGYGQPYICAGFSPGSSMCWGQGPKPVTTEDDCIVTSNTTCARLLNYSPSGLQPASIRVSGHSQLPVRGL